MTGRIFCGISNRHLLYSRARLNRSVQAPWPGQESFLPGGGREYIWNKTASMPDTTFVLTTLSLLGTSFLGRSKNIFFDPRTAVDTIVFIVVLGIHRRKRSDDKAEPVLPCRAIWTVVANLRENDSSAYERRSIFVEQYLRAIGSTR